MVDVLLAGSPGLDRKGLIAVLREHPDISIDEVTDLGDSVVGKAAEYDPDVVVLYLRSFGEFDETLVQALKVEAFPVKLLVLSPRTDRQAVIRLLNAGANGHVSVRKGADEVGKAVRALASGRPYLCPSCRDPEVSRALADDSGEPWPEPHDQLTDREREVLELLRAGHSAQAIAEALHISVRTAEQHLRNARNKLGFTDQKELLRYLLSQEFPRADR